MPNTVWRNPENRMLFHCYISSMIGHHVIGELSQRNQLIIYISLTYFLVSFSDKGNAIQAIVKDIITLIGYLL